MYQPNLQHVLAKSTMPRTMQDYNAALTSAGSFLREIEKAHANPLPGDPLAKSTFSESTFADLGPHLLRPRARREIPLSAAHAAAQRDPARVRQGRHPGQLARGHRHQHDGAAHRRLRRQSRRRAGGDDAGLQRRLQGHRHRNLGRFRGAICRHGLRRRQGDRRQDRARSLHARRGAAHPRRQHLGARSAPRRRRRWRRRRRAAASPRRPVALQRDLRRAHARRRRQRQRRRRHPGRDHAQQRRRLVRHVRRRRRGQIGERHRLDLVRHAPARSRPPSRR